MASIDWKTKSIAQFSVDFEPDETICGVNLE